MTDNKKPEGSAKSRSGKYSVKSSSNYKHEKGRGVKRNLHLHPPRPKKVGQLVHLVLHFPHGDESVYYPQCSRCGYAIVDLSMGNVCVWDRDDFSLTPLGWQDEIGCRASLAAGQIYFFHKDCDNSQSGSAWANADDIFKSDQRFEFQKRWEREARDGRADAAAERSEVAETTE